MNPLISIVVPVYNVEKYITRCLDSILNQTYTNFELILINDGSTDSSGKICEDYQSRESRITVLNQENQGLSAARNEGIEIAQGKYITFIDSDDYVYPKYLEKLLNAIIEHKADISLCGSERFTETIGNNIHKNIIGEKCISGKDACKEIYMPNNRSVDYVVAWGKLYKREMFCNYRYPIGRLHEDQFVTYKLFYDSDRVVEVGECLYGYFQNPNGIMRSNFSIRRYDEIVARNEAKKFFEEKREYEIVRMIDARVENLIAEYSIRARNAGIYKQIPRCYKMTIRNAIKTLRKSWGVDRYEYFMFQYHPRLVTFEARIRRLRKLIKI